MIKTELKLINMKDVEVKEVEWLWKPYIPSGKITILQGDPGEGKTTMILAVASSLTTGSVLPLMEAIDISRVIYQTAEDGLGDTIKPRLLSTGADCSNVIVIDESEKELTLSDERIEKAIIETGAKLIIIDPLQAYLGAKVDMYRANEIRPIFKNLASVAEKTGCAIVIVGHMNKGSSKGMYRGLGSIDISAAARSVLVVGRVKDDPNIRIMAQIKSSLAPEGKPIAFELDDENGFSWIGEYDIDIDVLLSGVSPNGTILTKAEKLIKEVHSDGPVLSERVFEKAKENNISQRTLKTAKKNLNVKSVKTKDGWEWSL